MLHGTVGLTQLLTNCKAKIVHMDTATAPAPSPILYTLTLREKFPEHGDVWSFRFASETPLAFLPGQYVHLKLLDPALEKSVHHMSLASAPGDPLLQFTMHMRADSPYKRSLAALDTGGSAALFKVKGEFTLPEAYRPVVLIAGGVGVTPYRAMLRHVAQTGRSLPATLLHVDRGPHLFAAELAVLPARQHRIGRGELDAQLVLAAAAQPDALYYAAG
jgi:ferredoxin-NADP reductase